MIRPLFLLASAAVSFCLSLSCISTSAEADSIDYARDIRPILSDRCYSCHGPSEEGREGGLQLDSKASALGESESGERAIVPGDFEASELYRRILSDDVDERMPPLESNKTLSPEEIEGIKKWIEEGAAWNEHWAFVTLKRAELPPVRNQAWAKTPLDHFILASLEEEGLAPSAEANRETLIRRVSFDLTGLPPTLEEIDDFLAAPSPKAYENLVDRLLASPRYGEHMARYWLDAARYSDTHGMHFDNYREMWPYRDWVVRAFNDNMPYDQFAIEQLAGDLLPNATTDQRIATGFNRCHVTTNEAGSIEEEVYVRNVVDRVVTTGTVFMGMTFECTRCHDHKYDPLTMKDFYSLFAFFNSLDAPAKDGNLARHGPYETYLLPEGRRSIQTLRDRVGLAESEIAALRKSTVEGSEYGEWIDNRTQEVENSSVLVEIGPILAVDPKARTGEQNELLLTYFLNHHEPKAGALSDKLTSVQKSLDTEMKKWSGTTLVWRDRKEPRSSYILTRGEYDKKGDLIEQATPAMFPPMPEDAPKNRLGFAQWLVSREHPLTARVIVNRLWQQIFGIGIVKTSEDFGSQGEPPSHPELLDWLALQFVEDAWDVKQMMKRIVLSAAYRQSSAVTPKLLAKDPENRLIGRGPRFRLDAEMLRDQALFVSGLLVNKMGGPSVKPPQPAGLWAAVAQTASNTAKFKSDSDPDKVHRRTLYTFIKRTAAPPETGMLDAPTREFSCVRRERTNTPLQALLLLNDPQYFEAARALAERTIREGGTLPEERTVFMFRLCTGRRPTEKAKAEIVKMYQDYLTLFEKEEEAKKLIVVGELPPGSRVSRTEIVAWTMVGNLLLNLDETLTKF